jgi:EmrB/QacA subfamily drug resistance transporter
VTTLASFLAPFMGSSVNVALPTIGWEFGITPAELSWVATSYLLSAAVCLVPLGRIADTVGRRRVFTTGAVVYTVASAACAIAPSLSLLIAARVLLGVGGAMIFATSLALLTSVYPATERGRVLGINVASVYLGLSVGPFAGGLLTQYAGWRSVFAANVCVGAIIIVAVISNLRGEWRGSKGGRFDAIGSVLYGLGLTGAIYGLSKLPSLEGMMLVVGGFAVLGLFFWWEVRVESPVLPVGLLRGNPVFGLSNLAALINYSATFGVTFLLSLYLQGIRGFDPRSAGILLVAQPVVMTVASPAAGRMSDRVQPRLLASLGMGLTAAALGVLIFLTEATPLWLIVLALLILGLGFGLFSSPNSNAVMGSVERSFYGTASATLATMRLTGQMFSMAITTVMLALLVGGSAAAEPLLNCIRWCFGIFALLCVFGVYASSVRPAGGTR